MSNSKVYGSTMIRKKLFLTLLKLKLYIEIDDSQKYRKNKITIDIKNTFNIMIYYYLNNLDRDNELIKNKVEKCYAELNKMDLNRCEKIKIFNEFYTKNKGELCEK